MEKIYWGRFRKYFILVYLEVVIVIRVYGFLKYKELVFKSVIYLFYLW